jgi:hypothetical protein
MYRPRTKGMKYEDSWIPGIWFRSGEGDCSDWICLSLKPLARYMK